MKHTSATLTVGLAALVAFTVSVGGQQASVAGTATTPANQWPPELGAQPGSPALSPEDALRTFSTPPGFHVELVASEPMIESPIIIEFDADGRMYVVEMPSFLPDESGRDSREPINRIVILEDTDDDGMMDKRTVFADGFHHIRGVRVLRDGVLVGVPPHVLLMKDTDGDLKADTREIVVDTYGNPNANIEHNANSLYWALDNTLYSSEHEWDLRWKNGTFEGTPALRRGQWLVSQDDAGRIFRNVNSEPLFVDFTPSAYFLRNPNVARTRGLYEPLINQIDAILYPVRPTRGVNRGYRDPFFREDGSSIVIQGAGTPMVYRGDRYPEELRGDAFITDSPTNLVHRFGIVDQGGGLLTANNGYDRGEFLASSDERFRPVSLADGPDGNLYVVDMYRGVVQAEGIWSDYLTEYIHANQLQLPVQRGRIWRVVYGTGPERRGPRPALSSASNTELLAALASPIGWWRDRAQQLLVQGQDASVVPALQSLVTSGADWRTRLHALWTVDGLGAMSPDLVLTALSDAHGDVRASAIRVAERWLRAGDPAITAAVLTHLSDEHWNVRRQVAVSIGEMPAAARRDPAVAMLSGTDGSDGIIVDGLLSGLQDQELEVLRAVLAQAPRAEAPAEAVSMLAATITKSGNATAVQEVIRLVEAASADWQRMALLRGLDIALPERASSRGRGLPGLSFTSSVPTTPGRGVTLPAAPDPLTRVASGTGDVADAAKMVIEKLDWPGRPAPVVVVTPLTEEQEQRRVAGAEIYKNICLGCHMETGLGQEKVGANLVTSAWVDSADPTASIRVLLGGKEGTVGLMPPLAATLSDEQIASVLTYVRREWNNVAPAVDPLNVMEVRGLTRTRTRPWTDEELQPPARGGRRGGGAAPAGRGGGRGPAAP